MNLLIELAKQKAAKQAAAAKSNPNPGRDKRTSKKLDNQAYTWRGGRNGQGKP